MLFSVEMRRFLIRWLVIFLVTLVGGLFFHAVLAGDYFLGTLNKIAAPFGTVPPLRAFGTLIFVYAMMSASIVYFVVPHIEKNPTYKHAIVTTAIFRFVLDGMWHFPNFSSILAWSAEFVSVDMSWHIFHGAVTGAVLLWIYKRTKK